MESLCKYIYDKDATDRLRTRAILCHVYHHALHDNWFQARDLVLMSHLQENIQHSDPATQVCLIFLKISVIVVLFIYIYRFFTIVLWHILAYVHFAKATLKMLIIVLLI